MVKGYSEADFERFQPEQHTSSRSDFARDRARVLHSFGWRRLALKTQVLSPRAGIDFARNRLTHSLEVAQIGRELAASFNVSEDLVDTACLTHDLGHPPFGHNGEVALNEWADKAGGFEGNAQTLRILTRLESKRFDANGNSIGLNLTRATLDASCKYPWGRIDATGNKRHKFGYFDSDSAVFDWLRQGAVPGRKSFEAQVMDLADDIAYSVHDFEDAIFSEHITPFMLAAKSGHQATLRTIAEWSGNEYTIAELGEAYENIAASSLWLTDWTGSRQDAAQLKNFTSDMIGRFAGAAITATKESYAAEQLARYGGSVIVPRTIRAEIAVLKGIVAAYVMRADSRQATYRKQRELLTELLDKFWQQPGLMDPAFQSDFNSAESEHAAQRAVVDQVASLSDQAAIELYNRYCAIPLV
ncbi:deoxyguanosinetriphosphate triphosphohydrolase [Canibacter zhoujuaniae]|uniref:deoxyguanosinetriphosphate triphosphohydrolase n=1 Tax=Canibacter zhoujuaniae TaxID=2708343 RepID=UPI001FBBF010|nr:deoxyguanosinetriphosphate triphosphohydrolase [Canibacter zhoujuaniae]